ncbi:hypothetical protein POPTR_002G040400v4 [Populus trichocarpa]|uniref:Uncharacterized protein n=1 Tax=Populus trichocarpa TaxID=3694 RepID=A0ACC0TBS0_POPTR|nr:hypothetical protein POPTR_002G040400v4 [Populus trichocarpa]
MKIRLINHGISEKIMHDVSEVVNEFFQLPANEKERFCSNDPKQSCRLSTSIDYFQEKIQYWRDNLRHQCHPLEEHFQEVAGTYSVEVRKLSLLLLDLICEGLGLESRYFNGNGLSQVQLMSINHYPPSSDPSLTLGLPKHTGEVPGLQVLEDGKWLAVDPLPTAFVITIGYVFQVISNGKLKSVDQRVVTNSKVARTTVGICIFPSSDSRIEPAKDLVDKCHPPLYKSFICKDFSDTYISEIINGITTERYKLHLSE